MARNIVIVSGGRLEDVSFFRNRIDALERRLIIACDSGARHMVAAGVKPDILIGDMDSVPDAQREAFKRSGVNVIRHPARKDLTDTALALEHALAQKPRTIEIWGALGGRIDHALANIHLLIRGKIAGIPVRLVDEYSEVIVASRENRFDDAMGCLVSLLALTPVVEGITLEGFEYPLARENLTLSESRGISNIIIASPAFLRVDAGDLLVVRYLKKDVFPEA